MKKLILFGVFLCFLTTAVATHLRCGYIVVKRSSCIAKTVKITLTVFTNTESDVSFGEDGILSFGDGETLLLPEISVTPRPDLGPNIGMVIYTRDHIYETVGNYTISYIEPNRNAGVLNMHDSFETTFYTETTIDLSSDDCSPVAIFLAPPIFHGFVDSELTISLGASSQTSLVTYEMVTPLKDRNSPVINYQQPENMSINELTGLITWDTQDAPAGEYNFAVTASTYEKIGVQFKRTGSIRIDFQVILTGEGSNISLLSDNQSLDQYNRVLVKPGEQKKIKIFYEADDAANPILEKFSELDNESITFQAYDSTAETGDIKVGLLTITPQEADVRENAYLITVRGRLNGASTSVSDINYLIYTDEISEFPINVITGIEKEIAEIEAFPNPAQHQVKIQVHRPGNSTAFLYSMQGVLLSSKTFELETNFAMADLPAGIYICDVHLNDLSVKRIKLIKN